MNLITSIYNWYKREKMKVVGMALSIILALSIAANNFDYVVTLCCGIKTTTEFIEDDIPVAWTSSVWCRMTNGTRLCSFSNLCYRPEEKLFLFSLTEKSVLMGLTAKEDLKSIRLSSVMNHNLFFMNVAIIRSGNGAIENGAFISEPLFLLWRFKWDNIMHVIHDDILPLYLTYLDICKDVKACVSKYTLGLVDEGEIGPYKDLYSFFSKQEPLLLHTQKKLVCFPEVHAGILSTSIWFQYGFGKPQGPLNSTIPAAILHEFRDYIFQRYAISLKSINRSNDTILVFNRKLNRRILNYGNFSSQIYRIAQQIYPSAQHHITELDLSTHSLSLVLKNVFKSKIVVGMHGSAMILCLFLRPGSVVVELFPYAIQPKHVSYLKAFSNIVGAGIIYRSWVNENKSLTFAHPEAPSLLGGIHHLPTIQQELIQNTEIVPAVECCHNSLYLYRMFQDTIVGLDFGSTFQEALLEQKSFSEETFKTTCVNYLIATWYFPAPVTNITCILHKQELTASWNPPTNAASAHTYDVVVLMDNGNSVMKRTPFHQLNIDILNHSVQAAELWVKVVSTEGESVDVYVKCLRRQKNI